MKNIIHCFLLAIILLCFGCKKYNSITNDAKDDFYIYGRLFIQDSINGNGSIKPLPGPTDVKIAYANKLEVNLKTVKTDEQGYFTITTLNGNSSYIITAETTTGENSFRTLYNVAHKDSIGTVSLTNVTPLLTINQEKQNGVIFILKDDSTKQLVGKDCKACFYTDRRIWQIDTACEFNSFMETSNLNSTVIKTNILSGRYYISFRKEIGSEKLKAVDSVDINPFGIVQKDIFLK